MMIFTGLGFTMEISGFRALALDFRGEHLSELGSWDQTGTEG